MTAEVNKKRHFTGRAETGTAAAFPVIAALCCHVALDSETDGEKRPL